ncbi:hypothetical protein DPMN_120997 [Dreissena polymorpha]|uniref:Uncharacterized protein n=1 Tax=Dreissena polymorpha TaxID=45954 RepID=A0A9D4GLX9_DREPO|nr:hypothetical protein DPMN_120997 [Dreissena polymorpha]
MQSTDHVHGNSSDNHQKASLRVLFLSHTRDMDSMCLGDVAMCRNSHDFIQVGVAQSCGIVPILPANGPIVRVAL